ncbi:DUF4268 domain-containing protein [Paraphotobacterium marinum]|nr:DUF4268 domain-containing protein [Paraphotobacterium marinum]
MFKIDREANKVTPITQKTFSELNFKERQHLQEWIAKHPSILGEDLLIIQKEFSGFDDTNERLDLLALDKNGQLVIIENKLDDSGRDVLWQAIKYASYCVNMNKSDILDIFQKYLNQYNAQSSAEELILNFLDKSDIEEVSLNTGNSQRIILVAAHFRKEVTSSALWLLTHGIDFQCIQVKPYQMNDELILKVDQIIPTPESKDLMIGINQKEIDQRKTQKHLQNKGKEFFDFWTLVLSDFQKQTNADIFKSIRPQPRDYLVYASSLSACNYRIRANGRKTATEFYLDRLSQDENKQIFDYLYQNKADIEKQIQWSVNWERMDDFKAAKITLLFDKTIEKKESWDEISSWMVAHMTQLERVIDPYILQIKKEFKL